jgi:imidazolonepropionase-like amidohydrolase
MCFRVGLTSGLRVPCSRAGQSSALPVHPIVLHAARLLDIKNARVVRPGEVLVQGERIVEAGTSVKHPAGAEVIELGDRTLLPGSIDARVHLFLPRARKICRQCRNPCRSEQSQRC